MQNVYLKGKDFEAMEEVHEYLAGELNFPSYYGKNLSALYDVLTDICDDTKIVVDISGMDDETMIDSLERMAEVMTDAAGENEYLEVEFEQ